MNVDFVCCFWLSGLMFRPAGAGCLLFCSHLPTFCPSGAGCLLYCSLLPIFCLSEAGSIALLPQRGQNVGSCDQQPLPLAPAGRNVGRYGKQPLSPAPAGRNNCRTIPHHSYTSKKSNKYSSLYSTSNFRNMSMYSSRNVFCRWCSSWLSMYRMTTSRCDLP